MADYGKVALSQVNDLTKGVTSKLEENGFENPQGNSRGQTTVSVNETWKARSSRLGRMLSVSASSPGVTAPTAGTDYTVVKATITKGFIGIPMRISFGAKGSGIMTIYFTRRDGGTLEKYVTYISAGQPIDVAFDGEIVCGQNTNLFIGFNPDNANTICVGSIIYKEELVQWD